MKKMILPLVCLLGMSAAANAVTNSDVILQHGSKITVYDADNLHAALETAVDGDVVFLNEGVYPAFDITKKITVQGVGQSTTIDGSITIDIPNEPILTAPVLQYMLIKGHINIKSATRGLGIRQCKTNGTVFFLGKTYDAYIDRCDTSIDISKIYSETITINGEGGTFTCPYVKGLTATNSIIVVASSTYSTNQAFFNCAISSCPGFSTLAYGTVTNSIVNMNYNDRISNTKFINSYYSDSTSLTSTCTTTDCYTADKYLSYNSEDIAANGYYGTDGTIIGPLGGNTPFTLTPDLPKVKVGGIKVDTQKEELNVTLTTTAQ